MILLQLASFFRLLDPFFWGKKLQVGVADLPETRCVVPLFVLLLVLRVLAVVARG